MPKLILENPEPPFAELDIAMKKINAMLRRERGRDSVAVGMYSTARTQARQLLQQLHTAYRRTQSRLEKT